MKQQTAVEWLIQIVSGPLIKIPQDVIDKAKQMEKDQIIDAVGVKKSTKTDALGGRTIGKITGEEYYNIKYN